MSVSPFPWLTGIAFMVAGASWIVTFASLNVFLQSETPRWVVGRVFSFFNMAAFGGLAIGSWAWGLVSDANGPGLALQLSSAAMLFGTALGFGRFALPALSSLDLDPLSQGEEPELQLDPTARSGLIRIMIEYVIADQDVPEFTTLMNERKRIRQRNGAQRWSLVRDLQEPTCWIESFQFATWIEYVRYDRRTTREDATIAQRLQELHSGTEPPRVRRLMGQPPGQHPV